MFFRFFIRSVCNPAGIDDVSAAFSGVLAHKEQAAVTASETPSRTERMGFICFCERRGSNLLVNPPLISHLSPLISHLSPLTTHYSPLTKKTTPSPHPSHPKVCTANPLWQGLSTPSHPFSQNSHDFSPAGEGEHYGMGAGSLSPWESWGRFPIVTLQVRRSSCSGCCRG